MTSNPSPLTNHPSFSPAGMPSTETITSQKHIFKMSLPTQFVTIVIPVLNEAKIIEDCLNSVICQEYPKELMEILVVDGMSNDGTRDIVNRMKEKDSRIFLLDNPKKHVPSALNIGIRKARGSIIVRMDSHSVYSPHYVSTLVEKMVELDAWNVGGVLITTPANDSVKCLAIATCLSHPFGVGSSLFRIGSTSIVETDTVPFGCFKKSLFEKVGMFDEEMLRNEDEEINGRIRRAGGKIYLIPEVTMKYYPRDSLTKLFKMYYQYGLWKPLVNKKVGNAVSCRQFVPPLFVFGLVFGLILSLFSPIFMKIYLSVLLLYLLITISVGIRQAIKHSRPLLCLYIPITFFCLHLSYGIGYLWGLCNWFRYKKMKYSLDR